MLATIDALAEDPRPTGAKALTGPWRSYLRVVVAHDYRVVYTVEDLVVTVTIARAGNRRDVYRNPP